MVEIMAAKKLGIKEVPTMVAAGWSEAQKRAYVIAEQQAGLKRRLGQRYCSRLSLMSSRGWTLI